MDSSLGFFMVALAVLLLLSPFPFILLVESSSISDPTDEEALLSFKALITTPSLSSWNDSSAVCKWSGVFCDRNSRRVSGLDLHGLGLKGSISPSLGNLSSLRFLYLQDNRLSGALPNQIGGLLRLQFLNASWNLIEGAIPPNISMCSELKLLDLSGNSISGIIPPELELLRKLQILKLGQNQLIGTIPPSIGNLSSLVNLDLGTNTLGGSIPSDLCRLRILQKLQIYINNLTGSVPPCLYNLSSLVNFNLAVNNLWGELPTDVGFRLPNLLEFDVCYNGFTGPIPPSLNNITKIRTLRLSDNFLSGTVPPGLGNLPDLTMYNIGFNRIVTSGSDGLSFITSLTNSTKLVFLGIDGNSLEGVIPESVGNLSTTLSRFYMGGNRIYGRIPASIGRLTNLAVLNMSHNSIYGEIPPTIGQLKNLHILNLAENKISGQIPDTLGNLRNLTKLELYGNNLEGKIPSNFINYHQLELMDISSNKLNGGIPREIFTLTSLSSVLNLSKNSLTGHLPEEIRRLTNVAAIDLSYNLLSGEISDSIGNCKSLQYLSMSNNALSGQIPDKLGNLKGLQRIDLSSNQLSGPVPNELGELQDLQFLNLSFNNLEGEIPKGGVFKTLSRVHLEGNVNLCSSSICVKGRPNSSRRRLSTSTIIILASVLFALCLLGVFGMSLMRKRRHARVSGTEDLITGQHRMVSYGELLRATGNFAPTNLIGAGSFGSVYQGVLSDEMAVAVKVMNLATVGASKSFVAECEAMRNVRHRNLVKLVTLCSSWDAAKVDFLALVYELMINGSLEDWIRGRRRHVDGKALSAVERLDIAIGVASAVDYLHNDSENPVVHCDLKPSNVMLDEEMTAKVGDFGLARMLVENGGEDSNTSTNGIKGSIGYIPPEYGFGGKPSTRGDVYSYGIMLLELLTSKSPTAQFFAGDLSLEKWVRAAFPAKVMQVLDAELLSTISSNISYQGRTVIRPEKQEECLVSMVGVGLSCTTESPEARTTIRGALYQLNAIRDALMKPLIDPNSSRISSPVDFGVPRHQSRRMAGNPIGDSHSTRDADINRSAHAQAPTRRVSQRLRRQATQPVSI